MNPARIAARLDPDQVVAAFVSFPADWQGARDTSSMASASPWLRACGCRDSTYSSR